LAAKDSDRSSGADHMRIFSSDRCNQQCIYRTPHGDVRYLNHGKMLRFEVMPFTATIRRRLKQEANLYPISRRASGGAAKPYWLGTHREKFGLIGTENYNYCYKYIRLKIEPEARLRPFRDGDIDIGESLRSGYEQGVDLFGSNGDPGTIDRCSPDQRFNRSAKRGMSCIGD
jgi:molybdenum cofactor biosynthesis enzyme MoaA